MSDQLTITDFIQTANQEAKHYRRLEHILTQHPTPAKLFNYLAVSTRNPQQQHELKLVYNKSWFANTFLSNQQNLNQLLLNEFKTRMKQIKPLTDKIKKEVQTICQQIFKRDFVIKYKYTWYDAKFIGQHENIKLQDELENKICNYPVFKYPEK